MRDFFIQSLERVVGLIIILGAIIVVISAVAISFGGRMGGEMGGQMGGQMGGPLMGLAVLIGGALYLIVVGGFMYLGLGIYQNTKRSAEAIEKLASR